MIDEKRRIIVITPPKTAGVTVQAALGIPNSALSHRNGVWRHATLADHHNRRPDTIKWPVYMTVRSPYARLVSLFFYHNQTEQRMYNRSVQYLRQFRSCEEFLHEADFSCLWSNRFTEQLVAPMRYYCDPKRAIILRQEDLAYQMRLHFYVDVEWHNISRHEHWWSYYDQVSIARVEEEFSVDFDAFGYARITTKERQFSAFPERRL